MKIDKYKLSLATILSIISISYYNYDYEYHPNYEILDESDMAYGKYSNGYVYIGDSDYLDSLRDLNGSDIMIYENEKSMKIFSSYRIKDKEYRNEILSILKNYEDTHNKNCDRTIESMRMEWFIHNLLYNLNFKTERTRDVDFENREEELYGNKVLSKILKI